MKKIIFIANNNIGSGFSGGDRIFIEFMKNWSDKLKIIFMGSEEAIRITRRGGIPGVDIIETDKKSGFDNFDSVWSAIRYIARRTRKGIRAVKRNPDLLREADFVYSVSDFWPDFFPAFCLKRKNKKTRWIAGFYLFAPMPFSKNSPYKAGERVKGFCYWLLQKPAYWLVKKYADFVFVTSEPDVEKFITKKRGLKKVVVVRGGVDVSESEKYLASGKIIPAEERKYAACFVGRLHLQKGVLELVEIWKRVVEKKPKARLALIGSGSLENEAKSRIKKYNLQKNIDLLGFRDGAEKYEIFKQSRMILHPAIYDSGGMAAAEGMAWGLPAVSFDLPALKTYYPQGMLKTKCFDKDKFAQNIIALLDSRELHGRISREALRLVREKFDWPKNAERIYKMVFEENYSC